MSKVQMLRAFVKQRLTAGERLYSRLYDVQQMLASQDEDPPEQQDWRSSLDQEDPPEPPHIKEEQEELWTSQEGEQLGGLEGADITKVTFTPVPVKSEEEDEEKPQYSQLHQRQTEQMKTADGEDFGGPEPARTSDPDRPDTDDKTEDSSETEVSDEDWTESREPQAGLNSVINNMRNADRESFICSECGKTFGHKTNLKRHMRCHTGEKPFGCSFCSKRFNRREHLTAHMRCHSGEKPFSCSVCNSSFSHGWSLDKHMRVHTGEKPFGCSLCSKSFRQRSDLVAHFRIHTGEKPFCCSVCTTSFTQRHTLVQHMRTHTGLKPFICSVCDKRFSRKGHMTRHMTAHTGEKPFSCSVCGKRFTWQSQFKRHECPVTHFYYKPFVPDVLQPERLKIVQKRRASSEPPDCMMLRQKASVSGRLHLNTPVKRLVGVSLSSLTVRKMSRLHSLKLFVNQRLTAAVDEIFGHVERTITEYEEEIDRRHRRLLDVVLTPELKLRRAVCPTDIRQVLVNCEEAPPEQHEWGPRLDQGDSPEPPHIKEEQEELWTSQEGQQLQGLEEVKEEDGDEEMAQSSQLHQIQSEPLRSRLTGQMETEAGGEDCGGPEPARTSDPNSYFQPVSDDKASNSSEPETEVSDDDCKESREPQAGSKTQMEMNDVPVSDVTCNAVKKSFICCECGRKFGRKDSLRRHTRFHTGEKPYSCSVCGKRFSQRPNLIRHMRCHSGEKPFSCSFCDTSFAVRSALVNHMRIHTGEKPFSCLYCDKSFTQKGGLKKHMTVHTGEKPYSCPVCDKSFSQKANLTYHFSVHTGQKQFSCSVCDKRFTWQSQVKSHKCVGESSSNN
ncbi:zinc finger protein 2 homolog [Chelmon rostratus]|uniref:zinc finger protein 2 homolog n=1 Tax=Chelmon rostratus TaxID=109905 RepID=UPI001BEAC9EB|nr:zinc finger protein 2 homolog [Chelmon rostratus]